MLYLAGLTADQRRLLTERPVIGDAGVAQHEIDGFGVRIPGIAVTPSGTAIAVCQQRVGSIADGGENVLLFTNPRGPSRSNLTIRLSRDDGRTWPVAKTTSSDLDGYSDLAVMPDTTILCIWEGGAQRYHDKIGAARFNLDWVLEGND